MSLVIACPLYLSGAGLYRRPVSRFTYGNSNSNKTRSSSRTLALIYRLWSSGTFPNISKSSLRVLARQSNPAHHLGPVFMFSHLGGSHFLPLGVPGYLSPNMHSIVVEGESGYSGVEFSGLAQQFGFWDLK